MSGSVGKIVDPLSLYSSSGGPIPGSPLGLDPMSLFGGQKIGTKSNSITASRPIQSVAPSMPISQQSLGAMGPYNAQVQNLLGFDPNQMGRYSPLAPPAATQIGPTTPAAQGTSPQQNVQGGGIQGVNGSNDYLSMLLGHSFPGGRANTMFRGPRGGSV